MGSVERTHEERSLAEASVAQPGLYSTVQDEGRVGFMRYGVPLGGVLDATSAALANALVGNAADAAVIECTAVGPEIDFPESAVVAVCGGAFALFAADGTPLPTARPIWLCAGSRLRIGAAASGYRAYLAVHGGWQTEKILGSRSTLARYGIGKPLSAGDRLVYRPVARNRPDGPWRAVTTDAYVAKWSAGAWAQAGDRDDPVWLRAVAGEQASAFSSAAKKTFWSAPFRVDAKSDRMGVRLLGQTIAVPAGEMTSEPVLPGSVQVPSSGEPIVLLRECQTVGGYPKIATVINVDLDRLAQIRPGAQLRFSQISFGDAITLYRRHRRMLRAWLGQIRAHATALIEA
ncbi:hypothetical protein Alches_20260 [Alicyclobacillus hesperidum subsp. aegles]|uniref:5-oxoprolinase subunit C family protein n=1 Tax=Alicyclobacillus hesperidum TaxID=89784 RepID=UPI00071914E1|nr:biotin-dependent carboxyltransferase family protein [Alicyclobacillus hesperidum]GLG01985.1 hypothetical protein Alches_20260 [Alicyclobacillus hesperidum subsp. aegles]